MRDHARSASDVDTSTIYYIIARRVQERWWPRLKELDLRDTGRREVVSQRTNVAGCSSRKKTTLTVNKQIKVRNRVPGTG